MKNIRKSIAIAAMAACALLLSSCAGAANFGEQINRAFNGVSATMTTYNQAGGQVDEVHGVSFQVTRDVKFDTVDSEGTSNKDSSVLLISIGKSTISHVGSTLVLAQDGIIDVSGDMGPTVSFENTEAGTPWLNTLYAYSSNLWQGKAKTLMIRSQDGTPIAVYAGDKVEFYGTDIPKSTAFRIDGKYLLVYRADYTMYDTDLLG